MTQKHVYIFFANKILDFKSNGINMIKGRTSACLAGDTQNAAEDHSWTLWDRRNLAKESKRTDKNDEHRKDSNTKINQKPWNLHGKKSMIFKEFSNKNQLICILDAKVMAKTISAGWKKAEKSISVTIQPKLNFWHKFPERWWTWNFYGKQSTTWDEQCNLIHLIWS